MENWELAQITVAILLMFVVSGVGFVISGGTVGLVQVLVFSFVVVVIPVTVKKAVAYMLDSSVKHELWHVYRFGFRPNNHFKSEVPFGLIVPLLFSLFSLGVLKVMTFLTYETRALKHRAAKRFGFYSYKSMTDWHNGVIGAAGVLTLFLISLIAYFPGWESLSKMAAYYAFWNLVPVSKLDGTQIFFGSRILWAVLASISLIFVGYALVL
jgi:Zn-dependent protease